MNLRLKPVLQNLSLIFVGILIALVLAELIFVLFIPEDTNLLYQYDSIGRRFYPGRELYRSVEGTTVVIKPNSFGFNDIEHSLEKPADTIRIAIIGDSFVESSHVNLEDSFGRLLQNELDTWGKYEVLTFGISGFAPPSEYLMYKKYVRQFSPDIVILVLYPNNDIFYRSKVGTQSSSKEDMIPPMHYDDDKIVIEDFEYSDLGWAVRSFLKDTYYPRIVKFAYLQLARMRAQEEKVGVSNTVPAEFEKYKKVYSKETEEGLGETKAILGMIIEAVREDGSEPIVVSIPSSTPDFYNAAHLGVRVMDKALFREYLTQFENTDPDEYDFEKPNTLLAEFFKSTDVPFYVADSFFLDLEDTERLILTNDPHWTPAGNRVFTGFLMDALVKEGTC